MSLDINVWKIKEIGMNIEENSKMETIFSLSNGYFGTRGSFEEYCGNYHNDATYMNGFYDKEPIKYGESAYGYAKDRQKMIDIPNGKIIDLEIDGEIVDLQKSNIINHSRELDLQNGILKRNFIFETSTGKRVEVETERLVSMSKKELMIINYKVKALNFKGEIKFRSALKEVPKNITSDDEDPRVGSLGKEVSLKKINGKVLNENIIFNSYVTDSSELYLAVGVNHILNKEAKFTENIMHDKSEIVIEVDLNKEEEVILTKYIYYRSVNSKENFNVCMDELKKVTNVGFNKYKLLQSKYFKKFWEVSDIEIDGDPEIQAAIRYNMFNLVQNVGKDGKTNICAKGLTGEGYDGHYFWDTEVYVMPFFVYTNPSIARKLLEYRYSILDGAKDRAKEMSYEGALYPWRTINGQESSAYYPAGTAQIHINADIANAIKMYYEATEDSGFMIEMGLEMLIETSRFYKSYSDYIEGKGYCFNSVTGPDEYTSMVNNNAYTNMMIKNQLDFLIKVIYKLKTLGYLEDELPCNLTNEEVDIFKEISNNIYIKKQGELIAQDDAFFERKPWDFKLRPNKPLLLNYHPMVIYKHQVLKQADLVLAMYILSDKFNKEEKIANYNFYEPLTTHDSSLSECIHGIIASEIGKEEIAYKYFEETVKTDLYDNHSNVKDGVHIAAMAGSWLGIIAGFGGVRIVENKLNINPILPIKWKSYKFKVQFKSMLIEINVKSEAVSVKLLSGRAQEIILLGRGFIPE